MTDLDLLKNLPLSKQAQLTNLIYAGQKINAIKLYREATDCDLKTAKEAVETITAYLKIHRAGFFKQTESAGNVIVIIILLILLLAGLALLKFTLSEQAVSPLWKKIFPKQSSKQSSEPVQTKQAATAEQEKPIAVPEFTTKTESSPKPELIPKPEIAKPEVIEEITDETYQEPPLPENIDSMDLASAYQQKLHNADYINWLSQPGLPQGYQNFKEEYYIKHLRSALAAKQQAPKDVELITIPFLSTNIKIDGKMDEHEWSQAQHIVLKPESTDTTFYLQADENWLYLAADVPADKTATGFDQLRFYLHVDLDPVLKNERIHVNIHQKNNPTSIRETTVQWQGQPATDENQRWKRYPISDWNIYKFAKAAANMNPHRQFEAKLNLVESGLQRGVPFAAYVEVETDPLYENGKFKQRQYLGELGQQNQPVWMLIK